MSEAVAFYILSGLVLTSAWSVVRNENLFHAGLSLILCFVGVAGLYINLDAPFLGAMQVLIYAGAIAVLLLFGFMLTHDLMKATQERNQHAGGIVSALLMAAVLIGTIVTSPWHGPTGQPVQFGVESLARRYMQQDLVSFEVVALLLLASLMGAVVVARKEEGSRE
ncbi:MAG: NADH-quinone oxidoreductase subunit J [Candidatus Eremiobacteraeota bacterium]|nr:NADH-quinone oxidoreductase subunit J [Candidatus Eremiobacteraeota bacterium]